MAVPNARPGARGQRRYPGPRQRCRVVVTVGAHKVDGRARRAGPGAKTARRVQRRGRIGWGGDEGVAGRRVAAQPGDLLGAGPVRIVDLQGLERERRAVRVGGLALHEPITADICRVRGRCRRVGPADGAGGARRRRPLLGHCERRVAAGGGRDSGGVEAGRRVGAPIEEITMLLSQVCRAGTGRVESMNRA